MKPEVSFLIVCFNSEKFISKCIDSILNQSFQNHEIIIVDNNSSDDTATIANNYCSKNNNIRLISNQTNLGFGNAATAAEKESCGEFIAILNADIFLDSEWTSNLLKAFKSDNNIMSASGRIFFPNGELQSSGGMMDKYGAVVQRESKIFYSRNITRDSQFFYNDGSSFMVRKKIFQQIQFDSKLFLYYEDVDLSWKIHMLGYRVEFVNDAISYHVLGHSYPDMNLSKFYYIIRNRIYVCQKNYSTKNIIYRVPVMLFLIFGNAIFYDLSKKPKGYTKIFFKAVSWNLKNLKIILKEHKKLRLINKISDEELDNHLVHKSIEFAFVRKNEQHVKI